MGLALILASSVARAEEGKTPPAEKPAEAAPAASSIENGTTGSEDSAEATKASKKSRTPKGKRPREKEIEGTEARDRFKADTVIKSKYQLNGEQLEVDPD